MITKVIPDYLRDFLTTYLASYAIGMSPEVKLHQGTMVITCKRDGYRYVVDLIKDSHHQNLKELLTRWAEEDHDVMMTLVMGDL